MDDDKWRDEIAKELLRQRTKEDQIASIAGFLDVLRKWPIFRVELKKTKKYIQPTHYFQSAQKQTQDDVVAN